MTYDPSIPLAGDLVSSDLTAMQVNFSQANTIMNSDHYNFNYATLANRGQHRSVNFPDIFSTPTLLGNASAIYSKLVAGLPQLFFDNSAGEEQISGLTYPFSSTANGYVTVFGGIIIQWGSKSSVADNESIPFQLTFPNACLAIVPSIIKNSGSANDFLYLAVAPNPVNFTIRTVGNNLPFGISWIAVGN